VLEARTHAGHLIELLDLGAVDPHAPVPDLLRVQGPTDPRAKFGHRIESGTVGSDPRQPAVPWKDLVVFLVYEPPGLVAAGFGVEDQPIEVEDERAHGWSR